MALSIMLYLAIYVCHGMMSTAAAFQYTEYAKGVIQSPSTTLSVKSFVQCAATCKKMLTCSAFSTNGPSTYSDLITCSIALDGGFTWVNDADATLYLMGMTAAAANQYKEYAKGAIVLPSTTLSVKSFSQCAATCKNMLVCSAFSTRTSSIASDVINCSIAIGDFTWDNDPSASLYMEDIGQNTNWTLLKDGRFYKYVTDTDVTTSLPDAAILCNANGGLFPVSYPKARRDVIYAAFPPNPNRFFGLAALNTTDRFNRLWVTNDGFSFHANKSDPDQNWHSTTPDNSTDTECVYEWQGTWINVPCTNYLTTRILCRRGLRYERSRVNGKYYKLHLTKVTRAVAEQTCVSEGGNLANAYGSSNRAALLAVRAELNSYSVWTWSWSKSLPTSIHIAGTDAEVEGIWKMPDGTFFDVANKGTDPNQLWYPGKPDGNVSANGLVFMAGDYFADMGPLEKLHFLCEIVV